MNNAAMLVAGRQKLEKIFAGKCPGGETLFFIFQLLICIIVSSSAALSQSGSLLVTRPLPVLNFNLGRPGENPSRSNIRWFNARPTSSGDSVAIGDDFSIGVVGEKYLVNSLRVWIVTLATQDLDPAHADLRNSHPSLTLLGGKVSDGIPGISQLQSGTTGSTAITFSRAHYSNAEDYWTLPSARDEPIWEVNFNNLGWSVDGGTSYQFLVSGTPELADGGTTQVSVELHASSPTLGGNIQESADNLYRIARLVGGVVQEVGTKNSNPSGIPGTLPNGGWNKSSDINVQVFGDKLANVSGVVLNRNLQGVAGVTVSIGTASAASASDGTFSLQNITSGSYTVSATSGSTTYVPQNFSNPISVQSTDQSDLKLVENNFQIRGLFDCDPIGGITVSTSGTSTKSVFGSGFSLDNLNAGTYTLSASHPGFSFDPQTVTISNTDKTGIKITSRPASMATPLVSVTQTTATANFTKFPGYEVVYLVKVHYPNGSEQGFLTSKNPVELKNLSRGTYRIRVQAGIGPFGQRVATKTSPWKTFSIGSSVSTTAKATTPRTRATAKVSSKVTGTRSTSLRSLESSLKAERKTALAKAKKTSK